MNVGRPWRAVLYETSTGRQPVEQFIESLEPATYAKVLRTIELIEVYGPQLGMPHSRRLDGELSELRVRGKTDVRLLYGVVGHTVYILHGFVKKSQQTPQRELRTARTRLTELRH